MHFFGLFIVLLAVSFQAMVNGEDCIDTKTQAKEIAECCDMHNPIDLSVAEECVEKYKDLSGEELIACIYECVGDKTGVIQGTTVSKDKLLESANNVPDEEMKKVVIAAIELCTEQAAKLAEETANHSMKCSPFAFMVGECIMRHIYAECPESFWKKSDVCDKIKAGVPKCPQ
ncbi:uncharacterized protein LOC120426944 [Culex pipiens pallens]|nr:uncharacterized protein LOC120426944 [Culex pipiens pallens]